MGHQPAKVCTEVVACVHTGKPSGGFSGVPIKQAFSRDRLHRWNHQSGLGEVGQGSREVGIIVSEKNFN